MREYVDNGVRLGWIDPKTKQVEIYGLGWNVRCCSLPPLSGEDVLLGSEFE